MPLACKHSEPALPGRAANIPQADDGKAEALTRVGESRHPSLSADGTKVLFVSRRRLGHLNWQVYEMNLATERETRITFQNGDVSHPRYSISGEIVYASSTDELKESPPFLNERMKTSEVRIPLPLELDEPSEVYQHQLDGSGMKRITRHQGFDGWLCARGKKLAWTQLDKRKISARANFALPQKLPPHAGQFCFASNGKDFYWLEFSNDFQSSTLWVSINGEAKQLAPQLRGLITDISWVDNTILFAARIENKFHIYSVQSDGSCLTRRSSRNSEERDPMLSPDGKIFLYSVNTPKGWQIYRKAWPGPCSQATK